MGVRYTYKGVRHYVGVRYICKCVQKYYMGVRYTLKIKYTLQLIVRGTVTTVHFTILYKGVREYVGVRYICKGVRGYVGIRYICKGVRQYYMGVRYTLKIRGSDYKNKGVRGHCTDPL